MPPLCLSPQFSFSPMKISIPTAKVSRNRKKTQYLEYGKFPETRSQRRKVRQEKFTRENFILPKIHHRPGPSYLIRGNRLPKLGCFFWKKSKRPLTPPPDFWKFHCIFVAKIRNYALIYVNLQFNFLRFHDFMGRWDEVAISM